MLLDMNIEGLSNSRDAAAREARRAIKSAPTSLAADAPYYWFFCGRPLPIVMRDPPLTLVRDELSALTEAEWAAFCALPCFTK